MACSHRNLIVNGDFHSTIKPWTGKNIRRVRNPQQKSDFSILMGSQTGNAESILSQQRQVRLELNCTYYLTFRVINDSPDHRPALLFATVAYLDKNRKITRTTPLMLTPRELPVKTYKPYFSIVPPPPKTAQYVKVVFWLRQGLLYIDMIRLVSNSV